MFRFLLIFFLLYGGLHGCVFWKIKAAFSPAPAAVLLLAAIMTFMVLAPILIRVSEHNGLEATARALSLVGYTWVGLVFLFFSTSLVFEAWRLVLFLLERIGAREAALFRLSARQAFFFSLILALGIYGHGWFEARKIRVAPLTITTDKLPPERGRLRLVQISDVHVGLMIGPEFISRMLKIVQEAKPDILLSTGDLVDGQLNRLMEVLPLFQDLRPPLGKYAITGNHEFYAGLSAAEEFTREAGFSLLRGEGATVGGVINLAGIDDPAGRMAGQYRPVGEAELLASLPAGLFTILLKHQPVVDRKALDGFDLQLSGHTHRGQIFPFSLITRLYFPLHSGFYQLSHRSALQVSRGTGTWGPPIRFLATPEITVIDLVPARVPLMGAGDDVRGTSGREG